jgi:protease I
MPDIKDLRVAVIATDGVEQPELLKPVEALRNAGAKAEILSLKAGEIQCFNHHDKGDKVQAEKAVKDVRPED